MSDDIMKYSLVHQHGELSKENERLRAENEKLNGQAAMNSRLLTENAELREENRLVGLQMDRMADEIEKLQAALKPFADAAEGFRDEVSDDYPFQFGEFRLGQCRAAAAALKETGE